MNLKRRDLRVQGPDNILHILCTARDPPGEQSGEFVDFQHFTDSYFSNKLRNSWSTLVMAVTSDFTYKSVLTEQHLISLCLCIVG